MTGIVWFRRDLRLEDNPAWAAATASHESVVALFVLDDRLLAAASTRRRDLLFHHLGGLDDELGGRLTVRRGDPVEVLADVVREVDAAAVYMNAEVSPRGVARDGRVAERLAVPIETFYGNHVHPPGRVLTKDGRLSQVFTPFYKRWIDVPLEPWPVSGGADVLTLTVDARLEPTVRPTIEPGPAGARTRLAEWLERVDDYPDTRDLPAIAGSSGLSTDLKFGTIGARTLFTEVGGATDGRQAFVRQLAWRDWYSHTLALRPDLASASVNPVYESITWVDDPDDIAAWKAGTTGFPIVDAGIRQLLETGWMHNRLRMITASFAVKHLLIDWRVGERFFAEHLSDFDPAQNAGNWQWVAGTGPDAAPYFRIMNPIRQAHRFDPDGDYVRRWVPELSEIAGRAIHEPWTLGPLELAAAGVTLDETYPSPMIDLQWGRARALEVYGAARDGANR